jgi:hypothetical protein
MIFFAIFIVNSFLNSGLGYVGASGGVSTGLSSNIRGVIGFNLDDGLWCCLRFLLLRSVALVSLGQWNWSWVWEWLWVNEISSVSFNLDLSSGIGCCVGRLNSDGNGGGVNLSNSSISSLLKRDWEWIWVWLRVNEISSVSFGLSSGVSSFDSRLGDVSGLLLLLFLPLSCSLGEISITLSIFINFNISLNILLLWWGVHKGSSLCNVCVLIIIDTSVLWISVSHVVLVIWVKGIVSSLAHLSEGLSISLLWVLGSW